MFGFTREKNIVISRKDYNAEINKSYLEGYNMGLQTGRQEGMLAKVTPNKIRKCFGLEPLKGE